MRYVAIVECTQRNLEGKHVHLKAGQYYTPMAAEEEISHHLQPVDDAGRAIEVEFDIPRPVKKVAQAPEPITPPAPAIDIEALREEIRAEIIEAMGGPVDMDALKKELAAQIRKELVAEIKAATKTPEKPAGTGDNTTGGK